MSLPPLPAKIVSVPVRVGVGFNPIVELAKLPGRVTRALMPAGAFNTAKRQQPCPPGSYRNAQGGCSAASQGVHQLYRGQTAGTGALPPQAVGVGLPQKVGVGFADPIGNLFKKIAYALKIAPIIIPGVNYNNGRRFIQAAQTFLNRGDYFNAMANISSAYAAAGATTNDSAQPTTQSFNVWADSNGLTSPTAMRNVLQYYINIYGQPGSPGTNVNTPWMTAKNAKPGLSPISPRVVG